MLPYSHENFVQQLKSPVLKFKLMAEWLRDAVAQKKIIFPPDKGQTVSEFFELIAETHCFVLNPPESHPEEDVTERNGPETMDLPFRTCFFESCGYKSLGFFGDNIGKFESWVFGIFVHEIAPKSYMSISLTMNEKGMLGFTVEDTRVDPRDFIYASWIIEKICSEMQKSVLGVEEKRPYIKCGRGKFKHSLKPKQIIYIHPKKEAKPATGLHGTIDWTHRFEVRGHWRKIEGIGKNREGTYEAVGFTWVVPHTRGPENLPLIKKIRVMKGQENEHA